MLTPIVASLPLFDAMPPALRNRAAAALSAVSQEVAFAQGEALIEEGALSASAGYVLLDGRVEVTRAGMEAVTVPAPALLGEMQQFHPLGQRTATVRATGPVQALRFPWQAFYDRAKQTLNVSEVAQLIGAIEYCVRERFHAEQVIELPLFQNLPANVKLSASLLLMWEGTPVRCNDGDTLFRQGDMCGAKGYVLLSGRVKLVSGGAMHMEEAPALLGVMPDFDPDLTWSATATADGVAEVLAFSWQNYLAMLQQRATPEEYAIFLEAARTAATRAFAH
ncbi:MAG: cyclic nucleotide-binding domain-containing protein [Candidatus Hydrogenedentota bacterium]